MGHKLFSRYFKSIPAQVFLAKNINWVTKSLRLHSDASRSTTIGFNPQYHHQNHQGLAFRRLPYPFAGSALHSLPPAWCAGIRSQEVSGHWAYLWENQADSSNGNQDRVGNETTTAGAAANQLGKHHLGHVSQWFGRQGEGNPWASARAASPTRNNVGLQNHAQGIIQWSLGWSVQNGGNGKVSGASWPNLLRVFLIPI